VAVMSTPTSEAARAFDSDWATGAGVASHAWKALFALHAGKPDCTLRAHRAWVSIEAIVTSMATHAAGAGNAGGAADGDLILDVSVKLLDARKVAVEIVNLKRRD